MKVKINNKRTVMINSTLGMCHVPVTSWIKPKSTGPIAESKYPMDWANPEISDAS